MEDITISALNMKDIKTAKVWCDLDIIPEREHALQLNDNNFLIYSTNDEDVSLNCNSIPNEIKKLHKEISEYKVPTKGALNLENTTISSTFTLQLES